MFVYKVVGINRYSVIVNNFMYRHQIKDITALKRKKRLVNGGENWKELFDKFFLKYEKGKTIMANPDSCGIFCFLTKLDADSFIDMLDDSYRYRILKVETIGRSLKPKRCSQTYMIEYMFKLLKPKKWLIRHNLLINHVPTGTICVQGVKVLD